MNWIASAARRAGWTLILLIGFAALSAGGCVSCMYPADRAVCGRGGCGLNVCRDCNDMRAEFQRMRYPAIPPGPVTYEPVHR